MIIKLTHTKFAVIDSKVYNKMMCKICDLCVCVCVLKLVFWRWIFKSYIKFHGHISVRIHHSFQKNNDEINKDTNYESSQNQKTRISKDNNPGFEFIEQILSKDKTYIYHSGPHGPNLKRCSRLPPELNSTEL